MIGHGIRVGMAERLVADRTLVGLNLDQVLDQLGPMAPMDETACFSEWQLWYRLDADFSGASSLLVRFASDGRVVEAAIR